MIEFFNLPADEKAADRMVKEMTSMGYEGEDAQRLVDAAAGIAISMLRGMDAKVKEAASDETDRTVVQQLVLHQLIGSAQKAMELNAAKQFVDMMMEAMKKRK